MALPLNLHVTDFARLGGMRLRVTFNDGRTGEFDFDPGVQTAWTAPLADPDFFAQAVLDAGTLAWPGGLDFAPEWLYFLAFRDDPALRDQFVAWGYLATPGAESRSAA